MSWAAARASAPMAIRARASISAAGCGVRMASSAAAAGRSLALQACPWHRSTLRQTQGISNMGCHNGWILQQKRGMVNWDKISASKGAPQPPAHVPPPLPPPSPSPSGPPAAQAPGTPPPLATAATLSEEEARAKLEELLSEPYLAVQRRLEMANLIIGFEQANHYTLFNRHGQIVGYMAEESQGMGQTVVRQVARTHRPFKATIFDTAGHILCRIDRPFYWISSNLTVQTVGGKSMGEIFRNWHLWRRKYELYSSDKAQFARIDAPLLSWEFTMEDEEGRILAAVDKNFAGLGTIVQTIFTDAHTYIVHLDPGSPLYDFNARLAYDTPAQKALADGSSPTTTSNLLPPGWEERRDDVGRKFYANPSQNVSQWDPPPQSAAQAQGGQVLVPAKAAVGRRLTLEERAVVLGCAMSIDFDFFSRHSGGGIGMPLILPIPIGGGGGGGNAGDAGVAAGAAGGAAAGEMAGDAGGGMGAYGGEGGSGGAGQTLDGEKTWGEQEEVWQGEGGGDVADGAGSAWDTAKDVIGALTGWDE